MKIIRAVTLGLALTALTASPAIADDHFKYKNPWKPTKNVKEIPNSLYRGFHYEKKWEPFRKCVLARESGANFKADSSGGSGAFQFI